MISKRNPLKMSVPAINDEFMAVLNGCMNTNPPHDENAFLLAPYIGRMEELLFGICQKLTASKFKPTDIRYIDLAALASRMGDAVAAQRARRDELPTVDEWMASNARAVGPSKPCQGGCGKVKAIVIRGTENDDWLCFDCARLCKENAVEPVISPTIEQAQASGLMHQTAGRFKRAAESPQADPLDSRYTIRLEFCGYESQRYVTRFCGVWVGQHYSLTGAELLAQEHARDRAALATEPVATPASTKTPKYTLEAGRMIAINGVPSYNLTRKDMVSPTDADTMARHIVALLNYAEWNGLQDLDA